MVYEFYWIKGTRTIWHISNYGNMLCCLFPLFLCLYSVRLEHCRSFFSEYRVLNWATLCNKRTLKSWICSRFFSEIGTLSTDCICLFVCLPGVSQYSILPGHKVYKRLGSILLQTWVYPRHWLKYFFRIQGCTSTKNCSRNCHNGA